MACCRLFSRSEPRCVKDKRHKLHCILIMQDQSKFSGSFLLQVSQRGVCLRLRYPAARFSLSRTGRFQPSSRAGGGRGGFGLPLRNDASFGYCVIRKGWAGGECKANRSGVARIPKGGADLRNAGARPSWRAADAALAAVASKQPDNLTAFQIDVHVLGSRRAPQTGHRAHLPQERVDKTCADAGPHLSHRYSESRRRALELGVVA